MEVSLVENMPSVSLCKKLLNHLHFICLARGLDVTRPVIITNALTSINNHIIIGFPAQYAYKFHEFSSDSAPLYVSCLKNSPSIFLLACSNPDFLYQLFSVHFQQEKSLYFHG